MGAIERFLKRRGYARLDRYGLILTAEDRVISTRPAVLDDGVGGRIVGWLDGDLAAMELEHHAPKPKRPRVIKQAPLVRSAPKAVAPIAPVAAPVAVTAPAVEAQPQVDEDDWEWQIAMARARAAADEQVEDARVDLLGAQAVIASAVVQRKTTPGFAAPNPPDPMASWPQTEPYNESWGDHNDVPPRVLSPFEKELLVEKRSTIIPVPTLPTVSDPRLLRPVTKSPPRPRRMARGTGTNGRQEDTVRTQHVTANEDKTSPYIELPIEAKPSGFAHPKLVAAKHR